MLRGRALVLTLCALVFATSLVVAAEPGVAGEVRPFLNCVRPVLDAGGVLEAIFGYNSSLPTTVTIPIGGQNFFFPGQGSLGQPTVFEPGIHNNVFAARFQPTVFQPELTWFIDSGRGLQGGSGLNDYRLSCDPPRFREEWSETGEYIGNDMVHFQGAFWVLRNLQSIPEFPNINDQPGGPSSEWVQSA